MACLTIKNISDRITDIYDRLGIVNLPGYEMVNITGSSSLTGKNLKVNAATDYPILKFKFSCATAIKVLTETP